jgi:hypothetical protein
LLPFTKFRAESERNDDDEKARAILENINTEDLPLLLASMLVGNEIEIEVGMRLTPKFEKHDKLLIRGDGLGELIKFFACNMHRR